MHRTLPLLLVVISACGSDDRRPPPPARKAPPPALAHATQADLGKDLDDADRRGNHLEVRQKWQGQVLRWQVTRQRALCASAETCNVRAFPIAGGAPHGWMPRLEFAPGQYDQLTAACGDREPCELTIEGTLEKLELSADDPTNLTFANVRVIPTPAPAQAATRTASG